MPAFYILEGNTLIIRKTITPKITNLFFSLSNSFRIFENVLTLLAMILVHMFIVSFFFMSLPMY